MYGFNFNSQQQQQLMNKNKNSFKDYSSQNTHLQQQPYYSSNKNNFIQQPSLYNQYQEPQFVPHPSFFDNKNNQYFNPSNQYNINNQPFNNPRQNILESQQKQQQTYYSNTNNKLLQKPKQFNENNTFVYPPLQKQSLSLPVQSNVSSTIYDNNNIQTQQNKLDDNDSLLREIKEQEIKDKIEKDFKEKMEKELKAKMEKEFQEEKELKQKAFKEQLEREQNSFRELFEKELKELRLQIELEKQKLIDMEKQRLAELEKQRLAELEKQRLEEIEKQRLAELEKQRLAELEKQRLEELEKQRLEELEKQRLAENELEQPQNITDSYDETIEISQNTDSHQDNSLESDIILNQTKEITEQIKVTIISKIENEIVDHLKKTLSEHFKSVISDSLSVISGNLDDLKYIDNMNDSDNDSLFDDMNSISFKSNNNFNFSQEYKQIKNMDKNLNSNNSVSTKPPVPSFKLTNSLTGEAQPLQNTFSINESSLAARRKIVFDKDAIPKKSNQTVIIPFYESSLKKKKSIKNDDISIAIPFVRDHKIVVSDIKDKLKNSSNKDYNNCVDTKIKFDTNANVPLKNDKIVPNEVKEPIVDNVKTVDTVDTVDTDDTYVDYEILKQPSSFQVLKPSK